MSEDILNCASAYEECLVLLMCENERSRGRLYECGASPVQSVGARTYAGAVGMSENVRKNVRMSEPMSMDENKYAVVIKPKDESVRMSSEQVKERVMKELNIRVNAVRKTRNGGIAVETVSATEVKKMRECKKFEDIRMRVDEPRKIGAKILVFDVPCEMTNEVLMKELYEKNLRDCASESEFKDPFNLVPSARGQFS